MFLNKFLEFWIIYFPLYSPTFYEIIFRLQLCEFLSVDWRRVDPPPVRWSAWSTCVISWWFPVLTIHILSVSVELHSFPLFVSGLSWLGKDSSSPVQIPLEIVHLCGMIYLSFFFLHTKGHGRDHLGKWTWRQLI